MQTTFSKGVQRISSPCLLSPEIRVIDESCANNNNKQTFLHLQRRRSDINKQDKDHQLHAGDNFEGERSSPSKLNKQKNKIRRLSIPSSFLKISQSGMEYEGGLLNGLFDGFGILRNVRDKNNLYVYKGEWKDGVRSGKGHNIYQDESEYNGEWKNNLKHGEGIYKSIEGEYTGEWVYGERSGLGTMMFNNSGVKLEGQWKNDEFKSGSITYADGNKYQGPLQSLFNKKNSQSLQKDCCQQIWPQQNQNWPQKPVKRYSWRDKQYKENSN